MRNIPIICRPKSIISIPPEILIISLYSKRAWPRRLAAAPRQMKTKEKPAIKKRELIIDNLLKEAVLVFFSKSLKVMPVV